MALMKSVLLRKTIEVAARDGIKAFVVKTVSKECGCSEGLIFHYYSSKKELVDTCYRYICDEFLKYVISSNAEDLRSTIACYCIFMTENRDMATFSLEYIQDSEGADGMEIITKAIDKEFGKGDIFSVSAARLVMLTGCLYGSGKISRESGFDDGYRPIIGMITDGISKKSL